MSSHTLSTTMSDHSSRKSSKYSRDFVLECLDAGIAHKVKGEYKRAAIKYKVAIENLKLYSEYKEEKLQKATCHEQCGDRLFNEGKFKAAYKEYKASTKSLGSTQCSYMGCVAACLVGVVLIPR